VTTSADRRAHARAVRDEAASLGFSLVGIA
jgi:hypothetical protein